MPDPLTPTEEQQLADLMDRKRGECAQAIMAAFAGLETLIADLETIRDQCTDALVIERIGRLLLILRADGRALVTQAETVLAPPVEEVVEP